GDAAGGARRRRGRGYERYGGATGRAEHGKRRERGNAGTRRRGRKVMSKWLESTRCLVIAHRGASAAAPENTLAAFRLAADLGADGIELDVRGTADGQLVVLHDASVNRTTDGTGRVAALTLDQL